MRICKQIPNNVTKKEFKNVEHLQQNIPPEFMINEDCVKALKSSVDKYSILEDHICRHRFIFVSGMHFSGTSTANYIIHSHELVSGHKNTGAPEDEGMWLQDEYPQDFSFGGPCLLELHEGAYLKTNSVTTNMRRCIYAQWAKYWDLSKPILIEKSPPTLMQLEFREALFPGVSSNLITVRHPLYPCFWKFVQDFDWTKEINLQEGVYQKLTLALEAWLKVHENLITKSLPSLSSNTPTAIIMAETFFSDDKAASKLLEFPRLFFPQIVDENLFQMLSNRRLEFRGDKGNALDEFDPSRMNAWMSNWKEKMVESKVLSKLHLSSILKRYESRVNKFGYSLLDVSEIDQSAFDKAFSLDTHHIYKKPSVENIFF